MESEKTAGILGAIVALAVLAAAFYYVPPGSSKSAKPVAQPQQAPTAPVAAPAPRGPVIKEVPQQ
jgi:hypothetical protein